MLVSVGVLFVLLTASFTLGVFGGFVELSPRVFFFDMLIIIAYCFTIEFAPHFSFLAKNFCNE